jgi:IS30 family transposase
VKLGHKFLDGRKPPIPPYKFIDWVAFDRLCFIHCTQAEIASFFGCAEETIESAIKREKGISYLEYYEQKKGDGKRSLRRRMFELANNGNTTMLIWLAKNHLGMSDKVEQTITANAYITRKTEDLEKEAKKLEQDLNDISAISKGNKV